MTKKKSRTGFRNGNLFCFNCGAEYDMHYPQPIDMAAAMMKQFGKTHLNCEKTWEEPVNIVTGKSENENAVWWLRNGEQGLSSKAMFRRLYPDLPLQTDRYSYDNHPCDPDDFRRCYLLVKAVPQITQRLYELKTLSPVWSNLVDNWAKLTEMLEDLMKVKKDNGMYDFMKTLGC